MDLISEKTGIIGAGGWGTALATIICMNDNPVLLWSFENDVAEEINTKHTNSTYLPGIILPDSITCTTEMSELSDITNTILAVPTPFIREIATKYKSVLNGKNIINVAKGIERKTLFRVSEILSETLTLSSEQYAILTGPSHAEEVARGTPTAVVCASKNFKLALKVQNLLSNDFFRVYSSEDVIGCEIAGSVKNVIAIAAGIVDGLQLGDNTKATLITRGLSELTRLGTALGAEARTFSGLSGLGDLIVTCNSKHSRNRSVGVEIAKGKKVSDIEKGTKMIAEGIYTTESTLQLGKRAIVELPITEQVYNILFNEKKPIDAIKELMIRTIKPE